MHWIQMQDELPIRYPFSMEGFATIREPGYPPKVVEGVFHSGRDVFSWQTNPKPWMVKQQFHWEKHIPISKYDVVFCEKTYKDEEGQHYYVYPQTWITAWMPLPEPYKEELEDTFEVELHNSKYVIEFPEFPQDINLSDKTPSEQFEEVRTWRRACKKYFLEHVKGD